MSSPCRINGTTAGFTRYDHSHTISDAKNKCIWSGSLYAGEYSGLVSIICPPNYLHRKAVLGMGFTFTYKRMVDTYDVAYFSIKKISYDLDSIIEDHI